MKRLIEKYGSKGFYVDLGCSEERTETKIFEESGWEGLCIDGRINYAVYSHDGYVDFYDLREVHPSLKFYSGVKGKVNKEEIQKYLPEVDVLNSINFKSVKCKKLETILDENNIKEITLLKVDIEGSEQEVFRVFPFEKYKINYILIEGNFCEELFVSNGFSCIDILNNRDYLYEHIHS